MEQLLRNDIVGQIIKQVWRTPWWIEDEKYHCCDTFVELKNGILFQLSRQIPLRVIPIYSVDLNKSELIAEEIDDSNYNVKICEVLTCEGCPLPVIVLADRTFLHVDLYNSYFVGPITWNLGDYLWNLEDFVTYWGHAAVNQSMFGS